MSQYGSERVVNGAWLVPLIDGPAFQDAMLDDRICDVLLVDDGGNLERARATLAVAKRTMCGKPYRRWPDFTITFDQPMQPNAELSGR